jgi:uncharacterized protein (TIGR02147 family)
VVGGERIDIFEYLDYRAYLRDYYDRAKRARRGFSHRAFSRRAGLGSPNHLKRVMDGARNLTLEMAERFAAALGLSGDAAEYFVEIVKLTQAKTSLERSHALEMAMSFKAFRRSRTLDVAHAAYHSTWYVPAIRELAARGDFRPDPKWIASRMLPAIKPAEAKAALETLLELGLLRMDEQGAVTQSEPLVTTGPEMHSLHIANYHRAMMQQAAASIDRVASEARDISAVTLLVGASGVLHIKQKIQRFRRELLEFAVREAKATQVIQINFQLFPLTVAPEQESES